MDELIDAKEVKKVYVGCTLGGKMLPEAWKKDMKLFVIAFFTALGGGFVDYLGFYIHQRAISFIGVFIVAGSMLFGFFAFLKMGYKGLFKDPSYEAPEPTYEETEKAVKNYSRFVLKTVVILCAIIAVLYFGLEYYFGK